MGHLSMPNALRFTLTLAASAAMLAGCDRKPAQHAPPSPGPAHVGVVTLKSRPVSLTTELPGRTTAYLIADVRPQVGGLITKRTFTEGADVQAGQQLYQVDPATYQASYDSALATLAHNQAALVTARAKTARYKPLAAAEAVSRQDYDDAAAAYGEAVADIGTAKAGVEQARINLAYTKVQAPISGRIGRSTVTPGALVTASQTTALATVTQLDPIYVDLTQPATTLLRLRQELADGKLQKSGPNQAVVQLVLEDGSKYPVPGALQFSEVNVDQGTGTVLLRAIFPNPDHLLLPGLYVRAELQEGTSEGAILVPQQGVSHNTHGDPTALVVGPDNKVSLRVIQTSRAQGNQWVVTGGLAAGDKVILDGLQNLTPGATVTPTEVADSVSTPAAK
jgi:membrane fusion protein (multidrug efflux system)